MLGMMYSVVYIQLPVLSDHFLQQTQHLLLLRFTTPASFDSCVADPLPFVNTEVESFLYGNIIIQDETPEVRGVIRVYTELDTRI